MDIETGTRWSAPPPCPRAIPGTVDVWRIDLDTTPDGVRDLLCTQERARATRIVREPARTRWARSRGLLRNVLGRYLEHGPEKLRFEVGAHGKPALADAAGRTHELRFNLSHSDRFMLVAVSTGREVGVDVELVRERHAQELLRAWTMREAAVKCLGTGLAAAPAGGDEDGGRGERMGELWSAELDPGPWGAVAAIAAAGREACELRCWDWLG
jgi:phosphopantetheinyl transferase